MWTSLYRYVLASLLLIVLSGCSGVPTRSPETPPAAAKKEVTSNRAEQRQPVARPTIADNVRQLLGAAEAALAADKLTTPLHDNAFDRFQAALLLDPGNAQARSGLQQVFGRYVAMARSALASNDPGRARAVLERARLVQHDHPALDELEAQVNTLWEQLSQQRESVGPSDAKEFVLDIQNLERKDEKLVERLKELAVQVKESDETLLIIARNDAEGRWIYQRMSEGVEDYRLRGDIQLGRTPKILVLPPID